MSDVLSEPFVDFLNRVVLPGLSVVLALLTLAVLAFTLRKSGQTLTRSVKPHIECYLRVRQSSEVFYFVIANFGLGSAYNVTFEIQVDEKDFAAVIRKKEDRLEAAGHSRSKTRNQRWIDFLRSTPII